MSQNLKFVFKRSKAFVGGDDALHFEEHTFEINCRAIDIPELRKMLINSGFEEVSQ